MKRSDQWSVNCDALLTMIRKEPYRPLSCSTLTTITPLLHYSLLHCSLILLREGNGHGPFFPVGGCREEDLERLAPTL